MGSCQGTACRVINGVLYKTLQFLQLVTVLQWIIQVEITFREVYIQKWTAIDSEDDELLYNTLYIRW